MHRAHSIHATILAITLATTAAIAAPYPPSAARMPMGGWHGGGWPAHSAAMSGTRQEASAPAAVVQEGLGKLQAFLASGGARDQAAIESFLIGEIAPYFDLDYMARWAAGPLWDALNDQQHGLLASGLARLFFANMAGHVSEIHGTTRSRLLPTRRVSESEATVRVRVGGVRSRAVALDFRLYQGEQGWRVFDIQANGQSAVTHYRRMLNDLARQRGVSGMLATLANR